MSIGASLARLAKTLSQQTDDLSPSIVRGTAQGMRHVQHINNDMNFGDILSTIFTVICSILVLALFIYCLYVFLDGIKDIINCIKDKIFSKNQRQSEESVKQQIPNKIIKQENSCQIVQTFYESGVLESEGEFIDGKISGELKVYYKSGNIQIASNYKDDIKNGEEIIYYENGQVKQQGTYINGKKDGVFKEYLPNGVLASETTYKEDVFTEKKIYTEEKAPSITETKTAEKQFKLYNPAFGNIFSFSGRINRLHCFIYHLIVLLICAIIAQNNIDALILLYNIAMLPIISKRLHDINVSFKFYGIYIAFAIVLSALSEGATAPMFIAMDRLIGLFLLFKKGTEGSNKYGPSPI